MNSCEIVSFVTAVSCAIANCVPREDLPLVAAIIGQIASTITTIAVSEERIHPKETPGGATQGGAAPDGMTPGGGAPEGQFPEIETPPDTPDVLIPMPSVIPRL